MAGNMFQTLMNLGVDELTPSFLRKKIANTNFIAAILAVLCIPFIIFTYISFPSLLVYPIVFFFNCIVIVCSNYFGFTYLSRFLACVVNTSIYTIYHCYLLPDGQPLIASLYAIQIIFWMVPWMLFDMNEKYSLITYVAFYLAVSLSIPFLNNIFSQQHDVESFKSGFLGIFLIIIAAIGITGPLFFFMFTNYSSEKKSMKLVEELEDQKKELVQKEEQLKKYVEKIEEGRDAEKKRAWASEGLAKFAEIMRNHNSSIKELASPLLTNLVRFVEVNQGALFVLNDSQAGDPYLELMSCYAYERKKFLEKRINIGEGLTGQCFLEKTTTYLKEIPKNYIQITSGLGGTPPTVLLLVPIQLNDTAYGVLELASFSEIPAYKIEFVERLCETIAGTLSSVKTNESIRKLLQESQQLTNDMVQREEEMRQNMEELSATQEEMVRKEREYQNKISLLEQAKKAL